MDTTLAMVLAGGRVDELLCLTEKRPKSALPIFGIYRIIDFALSNLMHSGINNVGILSQYRPAALVRHIGTGEHWDFIGRQRGVRILPPYQGFQASDWYKGTADAVYQNTAYIKEFRPQYVLIVAADHVYRMDYRKLLQFHIDKNADATICFTKVKTKTTRFGYGIIKRNGRVTAYTEKPKTPISEWVSMTVYVFNTDLLLDILRENAREPSHEFGRDIIPSLISGYRLYGFKFDDYWAYARTIESYYQTNMDLLKGKIDLQSWQIRTNLLERCTTRDRLPARINGEVSNSVISEGCIIEGKVKNSVLSPGVTVASKAEVADSIIFHDTNIEHKAILKKVICDKDSQIGASAIIGASSTSSAKISDTHISCGITVLGKNSTIPQKAIIPANTVLS